MTGRWWAFIVMLAFIVGLYAGARLEVRKLRAALEEAREKLDWWDKRGAWYLGRVDELTAALKSRTAAVQLRDSIMDTCERRLRLLARAHSGDEHPVLETGIVDLANMLQTALHGDGEGVR